MKTSALFLTLIALLAASVGWAAEQHDVTKKSESELLYEKVISENTKDASKAYVAYQKTLEVAKVKVLKALEAAKKDLNDTKKGNLSIQERAAAISAIDIKIKEVNEGSVGDAIIAQNRPQNQSDIDSPIRIISAMFGARDVSIDVTQNLKDILSTSNEKFQLNDKIFGDPTPGERKTLTIIYTIKGKKKSAIFQGWDFIDPALL
jgi:hypothetical protein